MLTREAWRSPNPKGAIQSRRSGARTRPVGRADILVALNLEAGNIPAKELTYAAQAEGAGLMIGAKVPALLTGRSDDERSRMFSRAVAAFYAHGYPPATARLSRQP
ncbi:hypothetical protein RZS28_11930 [Methylocapsa polymorpha]|uniref:Uncharacterized protein n=1 Tax=Methylocapsa polymorpha TaxID=3080828 RepID=A0ABZ0HP21_9HYPH|nr:hypothetical protein RZS28_11930 [Methylocapsa sp. RX1]